MNVEKSPTNVLRKHGKSFYFAGLFLGRERLEEMSVLYQFCRYIDDEIDEGTLTNEKILAVQKIKREIEQGNPSSWVVSEFMQMVKQKEISTEAAQELIDGVLSDSAEVWIEDKNQLDQYCYLVAGTVGIMSCPILGTRDKEAIKFAIDLGKAMQLTNICRDIVEDSKNGRVYIPKTLFEDDLRKTQDYKNPKLQVSVKTLLMDAERLYSNAEHGLAYLPFRSKLAIFIAMHLYREIGRKILRSGGNFWSGKVYTTKIEKLKLSVVACCKFFICTKLWFKKTYELKAN